MTEVPCDNPATTPVAGFTVATVVVRLLQVPPVDPSVRLVVVLVQRLAVPDIAAGTAFTVTTTLALPQLLA